MRVTDPRTLAANTLVALRTDPNAAAILRLASSRKERIYIVGGYLRDVALGFTPRDVDLVMRDATAAAREFAKETGASLIALQEREDGVLRRAQFRLVVRSSGGEGAVYDFGEMCEGGIESDLSQRDFTINAIALPLPPAAEEASPVVIAPSGALADLADRLVRLVRPDAVERDSLRILRAFRFAATLDFSIEPATSGHLARMASRVCEPAPERTQAELLKMMSASRSARVVRQMAALGVLTRLFPELEGTRGVMQPRFHHLDVFEHSIATYEALEDVVADLRAWLGEWAPGAARYLAEGERPALLKLAALLHDVGKPETRTEQEDGTVRFHHHDERGAEMMGAVARRLRLSREQSAMLTTLVRHHMRPLQLTAAERAGQLTARAARRMRRDCRPHAVGLLLLAFADALAARGPEMPADAPDRLRRVAVGLLRRWHDDDLRAAAAPRLLTGHDVLAELGVEPGPIVGAILDAVAEAQLDGQVATRDEALALARDIMRRTPREPG